MTGGSSRPATKAKSLSKSLTRSVHSGTGTRISIPGIATFIVSISFGYFGTNFPGYFLRFHLTNPLKNLSPIVKTHRNFSNVERTTEETSPPPAGPGGRRHAVAKDIRQRKIIRWLQIPPTGCQPETWKATCSINPWMSGLCTRRGIRGVSARRTWTRITSATLRILVRSFVISGYWVFGVVILVSRKSLPACGL